MPHVARHLVRLLAGVLCFTLVCCPLAAKESVVEVGRAFTCHFQNKGDAGLVADELRGPSAKDWTAEETAAVRRALEAWDAALADTPPRRLRVGLYWIDFESFGRGLSIGGSIVQIVPPGSHAEGAQRVLTRPELVWREGGEPGAGYDILLAFNCRPGLLYFGEAADDSIGERYDFQSVVMHEVGHALGIGSALRGVRRDGESTRLLYHTENGGRTMYYTTFDTLMHNAQGESVVRLAARRLAETGVASGVNTGERITLAGSPLTIHNPVRFKLGTSGDHFDKADALMQPKCPPGRYLRRITPEERGVMRLMGWNIRDIPLAD